MEPPQPAALPEDVVADLEDATVTAELNARLRASVAPLKCDICDRMIARAVASGCSGVTACAACSYEYRSTVGQCFACGSGTCLTTPAPEIDQLIQTLVQRLLTPAEREAFERRLQDDAHKCSFPSRHNRQRSTGRRIMADPT